MKKLFVLLVLVALALSGCGKESAVTPELLTPVGALTDSVVATYGDMEEVLIYKGAFAVEYRELSFTHDCAIAEICVPLGGQVAAGERVAVMDVSAVRAEIGALEAEKADIAEESEYERRIYEIDAELYALDMKKTEDADEKYDIETEIELAELEFSNAQARRDERVIEIDSEIAALEKKLEGTELVSPCSGRLAFIAAPAGTQVGAYDTVCVVTDKDSLIVQSPYISSAVLDSAVEIYALSGDARLALTPRPLDEDEYARTVLRGGSYLTEYSIEDDASGIAAGDGAAICVVTQRLENVLRIPVNALYGEAGEYYVYVMDGENRVRRDVSVGLTTSVAAEILSGVEEGERVYVGN